MGQPLGQHFLCDQEILNRIKESILGFAQKEKIESCVEIGPGQGVLTKLISSSFERFCIVEKDLSLKKYILPIVNEKQCLWGDILETSIEKEGQSVVLGLEGYYIPLDDKNLLVGNLPYYITSPIFRKFFVESTLFCGGVFLIQKEVADKIKTNTAKKSFLWRLVNYYYEIEYNFTVPPTAFNPPPKVKSAVITFSRRKGSSPSFSLELLFGFMDIVNRYSRKTLGKIFKMRKEDIEKLGVTIPSEFYTLRTEQLSWEDMEEILGR